MDSTTAVPRQAGKNRNPLINRNFALMFAGLAVSGIGDFIFNTTLVLWIAVKLAPHETWAPLAVSGVLVAAAVPVLLVGPLAGVFVDRWNKRGTMMRANLFQALVVAALLVVGSGVVPLPWLPDGKLPVLWALGAIYAAVFLVNAANQFNNPAAMALVGDIVAEPERARAMGLNQVVFALSAIVGPPIAAPLMLSFGVEWALVIDALSFVVAFGGLALVHAPRSAVSVAPGERGHFWRELGQGVSYLVSHRVLSTLLLAGVVVLLGAGALNALDVFFVTGKDYLNQPASMYGLFGAAQGVGTLIGAVLAGALAYKIGLVRTIWGGLLVVGILIVAWSRMTMLIPALVLLFASGIFQAGLNVAVGPLLLRETPRELVGRVTALFDPAMMLASLVSVALAGYLDSSVLAGFHKTVLGVQFHAVDSIFLVAGGLIIAGGVYAMLALRGVDNAATPEAGERTEDATPPREAIPVGS